MNKNLVIVQQYLSWKGHYKQYFENLLDLKYNYLYASNTPQKYENAIWIKSDFDPEKALTIKSKIKGRFLDSFNAFKYLAKSEFKIIHLIEFEPLTYLLFSSRLSKSSFLVITIHSSDRLHYSNWINNQLSGFQRRLVNKALKTAITSGAHIVTHYECHKESLLKVIGDEFEGQVSVINYPASEPEIDKARTFKNVDSPKYLIYGQIREDKGIYEFLLDESTKNLNITIAGKIVDRRILKFTDRNNLKIIDKFLSEQEINELVERNDFMLLPYPIEYTNGAGTFKDSLAKGMPVICSKIPIFDEIIGKYQVGLTFDQPEDIEELVRTVSNKRYEKLSQNCITYSQTYNWEYMQKLYFDIYNRLLGLNN